MARKMTLLILSVCLVLSAVPFAFAQTGGRCGENVTWTLSPDGVLTVSGTGEMWDYTLRESLLTEPEAESVTAVIIEDGVTRVGACAFEECGKLRSVSFGKDVQSIGGSAFLSCVGLTEVLIPENVLRIENGAFRECTALETLELRNGDIFLGSRCFAGCTALTTVRIPQGNPKMDDQNPFLETPFLKDTTDSRGFHVFGEYLLYYGGEDPEPVIPAGVRCIASEAFRENGFIRSITIPEGVEKIGPMAFLFCQNLREVVIPEGVKEIGNMAFGQEIALEKIVFRGDFPSIHKNAFWQTGGTAYMPSGNRTWPGLLGCYGGFLGWGSFFSTTGCAHKERLSQPGFDPDCTGEGLTDREICRECGAVVSEGERLPALNHAWEGDSCVYCGEPKPAGIPGDADGNGKADYADALMILRYSIGLGEIIRLDLADMNGDGRYDYNDALTVLRRSIGLE